MIVLIPLGGKKEREETLAVLKGGRNVESRAQKTFLHTIVR